MPRIADAFAKLWPRANAAAPPEAKASATAALVAFERLGQPVWSPRDVTTFAREGFMQNAIVYRCVRMISEAAASIPLLLYEGDVEVDGHPFLALLRQPSHDQTTADFLESWYGHLLVAGNAYAEAVGLDGTLRELHVLRPDRMKVVPGARGWPDGFEYTLDGASLRFEAEPVSGVRPILHMRLFHPLNDYYGMSPIEAAAVAIDIHNAAARWNKALLDNAARPSGALVYAAQQGKLTDEQFQRLKDELETSFQGARNAGRPMLLEGGLDWKALSMSPKDMDFIEAKNAAAREIALSLGVPPMLLGIPGDNTYSNYQEASRAFWRQTVLPLVNRTARAFSTWLAPAWRGNLDLRPDLDQVDALASERDALWTRLEKSTFLTVNEKRLAAGYPGTKGGDGLKYDENQPRVPAGSPGGGQWTNGGGGAVLSDATPDNYWRPGSRLAQNAPKEPKVPTVNLQEDEALGGHTIRRHVERPDEELLTNVSRDIYRGPMVTIARRQQGSYLSLEDANNFTNRVLEDNTLAVDQVISGQLQEAEFEKRFGFATGKEAFRPEVESEPYMRPTYSAYVHIQRDTRSPKGFRIFTSYPTNDLGK